MAAIFAKTAKGQAEITSKAGGLTPRVRRVLIFIDGKRSVDDLRGLVSADDLQITLGHLEEAGFIELIQSSNGKRPPDPTPTSITAFRPLPNEVDPVLLQQARNFMTNTLNAFIGTLGASSLLQRITQAQTHEHLRALFDEWFHTLVNSREGRREAEALRGKLLQVI
ncbi:MarR family transcriptional regulator [Azonexus sp.]|uniref:MarR family transcriptional regulator n=1 Tax=Azonexus sp. TaxID=1872668 RepID=UPI0039E2EE52